MDPRHDAVPELFRPYRERLRCLESDLEATARKLKALEAEAV